MNKNIDDITMLKYITIQALELTESIMDLTDEEDVEVILKKLEERNRAINIIGSISKFLTQELINEQFPEFHKIIDKIQSLDSEITDKLIKLKKSVHLEIAKTFKTKENFKGYNLNNTK